MRLGALFGFLSPQAQPTDLVEQAKRYAGEGFDSLWVAQAVGRGFMIPDPFVALATAATATKDVELGTAIVQISLYQPTDLAHRILSAMQVCGDRLVFGVGAGSTQTDFIAFERDYAKRFKTFNTTLSTLKMLLAEGKNNIADLTPWKTVIGGPPLLLGSWGAGVERAAKKFCNALPKPGLMTPLCYCDLMARARLRSERWSADIAKRGNHDQYANQPGGRCRWPCAGTR